MASLLTPIVILPSRRLLEALEKTIPSTDSTKKVRDKLSTQQESVAEELSYRNPPALLDEDTLRSNSSYLEVLYNRISKTEVYKSLSSRYEMVASIVEKAQKLQLVDTPQLKLSDIKLDYESWDKSNIEVYDQVYRISSLGFGFIQVPDNITTVYNVAAIINKLVIECLVQTLNNNSKDGMYTMFFASARSATIGFASGIRALRFVVTPPIYKIFRIMHSILLRGYKAENFYNSLSASLRAVGFSDIDEHTNVFIYYLMQTIQYIYDTYQKDKDISAFVSRTAMAAIILASLSSLDQEIDPDFNELKSSKNVVSDEYINYYIFEKTNSNKQSKDVYLYVAGVTYNNVAADWRTTHWNMVKEILSILKSMYKSTSKAGDVTRRIAISQIVYATHIAYPDLIEK